MVAAYTGSLGFGLRASRDDIFTTVPPFPPLSAPIISNAFNVLLTVADCKQHQQTNYTVSLIERPDVLVITISTPRQFLTK